MARSWEAEYHSWYSVWADWAIGNGGGGNVVGIEAEGRGRGREEVVVEVVCGFKLVGDGTMSKVLESDERYGGGDMKESGNFGDGGKGGAGGGCWFVVRVIFTGRF